MKFFIVDTASTECLRWIYSHKEGLASGSYREQADAVGRDVTGLRRIYAANLRRLGHEAWAVCANNEFRQKAWARENGLTLKSDLRWEFRLRRGIVPWVSFYRDRWLRDVLRAQIEQYRPDVVLNLDMCRFEPSFFAGVKQHFGLLVGQHAATRLPTHKDFGCYDLAVSSFPPTVEWLRRQGLRAELVRLGFEPDVLSLLGPLRHPHEVTFVGSFAAVHSSRLALLEELCRRFPQLKVWAPGLNHVPADSAVRRGYVGRAWGLEMFRILAGSKITLNHHGDIPPYANNKRLYEATGVGALLLTDWKQNLSEMFEPGKEVAAYHSAAECAELIEHYLAHDDERAAVARAGQERTLREHTYHRRMQDLLHLLEEGA